ncbi:unnamed protein product [marine sediment metagenome]|uniref:Uncharacterized protein n=1 Tax=marine sediment metagenome TaxID=412755 RepID=X0RPF7_9ZZZZ
MRGLDVAPKPGTMKTLAAKLEEGVNIISVIGKNSNGWSEPARA